MPLRRSARPLSTTVFTLKNGLALLVLLAVAGTLLVYAIKSQSVQIRTDPISLCRTDQPPPSVTVLLLDLSEEFTEAQQLKIRNELDRVTADVQRFGLIEAYAVDRITEHVTAPVVHRCNPGNGDDLNSLYQNPDLARQHWITFSQELNKELDRLMARSAGRTSPIFEAVQATALRTFNVPAHQGVPKRLVIVSDLLQNVPGKLSQYSGTTAFSTFKASAYFAEVRADLTGVTTTVLYLVRPRAPQPWPDHYRFWEQYFVAQGATVDRLEPVYGDR